MDLKARDSVFESTREREREREKKRNKTKIIVKYEKPREAPPIYATSRCQRIA